MSEEDAWRYLVSDPNRCSVTKLGAMIVLTEWRYGTTPQPIEVRVATNRRVMRGGKPVQFRQAGETKVV